MRIWNYKLVRKGLSKIKGTHGEKTFGGCKSLEFGAEKSHELTAKSTLVSQVQSKFSKIFHLWMQSWKRHNKNGKQL